MQCQKISYCRCDIPMSIRTSDGVAKNSYVDDIELRRCSSVTVRVHLGSGKIEGCWEDNSLLVLKYGPLRKQYCRRQSPPRPSLARALTGQTSKSEHTPTSRTSAIGIYSIPQPTASTKALISLPLFTPFLYAGIITYLLVSRNQQSCG